MASKECTADNIDDKNEVSRKKIPDQVDDELSELLDSALKDFDKPLPDSCTGSKDSVDGEENLEKIWENEFSKHLKILAQAAESATESDDISGVNLPESDDFTATLEETIKSLAENTEFLKNPLSDDDLTRLLGNMTMEDTSSQQGAGSTPSLPDIMPLMQNVMQNLLSKDLLYPPLKDVIDKYPDWIAENVGRLEESDRSRFDSQYELMKKICDEFETESVGDNEQAKSERFERILNHMQTLQSFGHPPKELIGNIDFPLNSDGIPKFDGLSPDKCSMM
ncbi:PEX19 (predicted) [Pycnogonum litorale]